MSDERKTPWTKIGTAQSGIFAYRFPGQAKMYAVLYRDPAGKRRRKMGFSTRAEAIEFRDESEKRRGDLASLASRDVTVAAAIEAYLPVQIANGRKESSYYLLRDWVARIGTTPLVNVTADTVERELLAMMKEKGWSAASRNRSRAVLCGVFTFAARKRWIAFNPVREGVERFVEDGARERYFKSHEIAALIAKARETDREWLARIILFGATAGCRLGEVCALRCSDYRTGKAGTGEVVVRVRKNRKPLIVHLEHPEIEQTVRSRSESARPWDHLFPGPDGGNAYSSIRRNFRKVVEAVAEQHPEFGLEWGRGVHQVSFHTLRHSMASLAHQAGVRESVIQELGGWSSPRMVKHYAKIAEETVRDGASKVAQVILGNFGSAPEEKKAEQAQ